MGDDMSPVLNRLRRHKTHWPPRTVLDMEDHLCRAPDLEVFWFFEMRDRANNSLAEPIAETGPCGTVHEYPPDWPQWRIESFELREAARAGRAEARHRSSSSSVAGPEDSAS